MLDVEDAHGLICRIRLADKRFVEIVFLCSVVDGALYGEPVVRRDGIVHIVVGRIRRGVERHKHRARRALGNAQAGIVVSSDDRLRALPVVDDVHAADLARIIDVQIVMLDVGVRILFDIEVCRRRGVCRVRRAGDHFERARRALPDPRAVHRISRDGIPAFGVDLIRCKIVQRTRGSSRRAGARRLRTGEINAVVGIGLQRIAVFPDGAVVVLPRGHVVVELRHFVIRTDAVEDDLAEVVIGDLAVVVLVQPFLIPRIFVGRLRRIRAHAIDLIVAVRDGRIAVRLVRNVHRIVDIRIGLIRTVDGVRRDAAREFRSDLLRRIIGIQRVVHFVDHVHGAVHLYKAVGRGVVRNTEIIADVRTVERGALEIEIGVVHRARRVADVVGRCVIDAVAVNEDARRIVRSDHQRGNDRLRLAVVARLDVRHLCPHERAFDGRAVGVVRRVRLDTVDEIDVVSLLHDEPALRDDRGVCRRHIGKRREFISAGRQRSRGDRHGRGGGEDTDFFKKIAHELFPQIPVGIFRSNDTPFIIY